MSTLTTLHPPLTGATTLRAIYPNAPADREIVLPVERATLFQSRNVGRWVRRVVAAIMVIGTLCLFIPQLIFIPFGWMADDTLAVAGAAMATVLVPMLVGGGFLFAIGYYIYKISTGTRLSAWAAERGFTEVDGSWIDDLPLDLCQTGHTIHTKKSFKGNIGGVESVVGGYQWVKGHGKHRSTGFVGLIVLRLPPAVAARFNTVEVLSAGQIGTTIGKKRELRFESAQLDQNLQVLVHDQQDDIPCFELFNPPFLELLNSRPDTHFEQKGEWLGLPFAGTLTPFSNDPIIKAQQIDGDCALAIRISERFCAEYR